MPIRSGAVIALARPGGAGVTLEGTGRRLNGATLISAAHGRRPPRGLLSPPVAGD